ncbi:MAG: helix-hairpin-helix domain-containing protein [Thermoplasmata archaeon]|nr:helix-hairpin-helix domain-containing protein [Thermoplasmata archaeon]
MAGNAEAAEAFREIADLLDVLGEKFKPEAYRRAARSIDSLTEDLAAFAQRDELRTIPGVGQAIEEKIREFLRDGKIPYLERLRAEIPPGIVELMRSSGIGPKTARRFWTDLGVDGPATLLAAIDAGKLEGLSGFGPKKIAKIRDALGAPAAETRRRPLREAALVAEGLVARIRAGAPVERIEVAGSLRRRRETVGDLDILVTSAEPERVLDTFGQLAGVTVVLRGPTKETIRTADGLQVDLRVVAPESFGAAWQYFTGSKDHNIQTRSLARDRGLKINEYAVYRGEERLPSSTEEEVYRSLDLPWIPAEIREGQGEVEAGRAGTLPRLLEPSDLLGELHVHVVPGTGPAEWRGAVDGARVAGLRYVGLVSTEPAELPKLRRWVAELKSTAPAILLGLESTLGVEMEDPNADFHISRATDRPPSAEADPGLARRGFHWVGHFGIAPDDRAGAGRLSEWVSWARRTSVPLEVTASPFLEGLDAVAARRLAEAGGRLVVSEGTVGAERALALAVGTARRGWIGPGSVITAGPWPPSGADSPRRM